MKGGGHFDRPLVFFSDCSGPRAEGAKSLNPPLLLPPHTHAHGILSLTHARTMDDAHALLAEEVRD